MKNIAFELLCSFSASPFGGIMAKGICVSLFVPLNSAASNDVSVPFESLNNTVPKVFQLNTQTNQSPTEDSRLILLQNSAKSPTVQSTFYNVLISSTYVVCRVISAWIVFVTVSSTAATDTKVKKNKIKHKNILLRHCHVARRKFPDIQSKTKKIDPTNCKKKRKKIYNMAKSFKMNYNRNFLNWKKIMEHQKVYFFEIWT